MQTGEHITRILENVWKLIKGKIICQKSKAEEFETLSADEQKIIRDVMAIRLAYKYANTLEMIAKTHGSSISFHNFEELLKNVYEEKIQSLGKSKVCYPTRKPVVIPNLELCLKIIDSNLKNINNSKVSIDFTIEFLQCGDVKHIIDNVEALWDEAHACNTPCIARILEQVDSSFEYLSKILEKASGLNEYMVWYLVTHHVNPKGEALFNKLGLEANNVIERCDKSRDICRKLILTLIETLIALMLLDYTSPLYKGKDVEIINVFKQIIETLEPGLAQKVSTDIYTLAKLVSELSMVSGDIQDIREWKGVGLMVRTSYGTSILDASSIVLQPREYLPTIIITLYGDRLVTLNCIKVEVGKIDVSKLNRVGEAAKRYGLEVKQIDNNVLRLCSKTSNVVDNAIKLIKDVSGIVVKVRSEGGIVKLIDGRNRVVAVFRPMIP